VRATLDFLRTVVFDRRLMPWFAEQYESPSRRWQELFNDILLQAADPTRLMADTPGGKVPVDVGAGLPIPEMLGEE
jgi:hypothetical protein